MIYLTWLDLTYFQLPNSSDTAVTLKAVDIHGSGQYRCEVLKFYGSSKDKSER